MEDKVTFEFLCKHFKDVYEVSFFFVCIPFTPEVSAIEIVGSVWINKTVSLRQASDFIQAIR